MAISLIFGLLLDTNAHPYAALDSVVVEAKRSTLPVQVPAGEIRRSQAELFAQNGAMLDPLRALSQEAGVLQSDLSLLPRIRGLQWYEHDQSWDGIPLLSPYHMLNMYSKIPASSLSQAQLLLGQRPLGMASSPGALYQLSANWNKEQGGLLGLDFMRGYVSYAYPSSPRSWVPSLWVDAQGVWYNSFLDGVGMLLRHSGDSLLALHAPSYLEMAQMPSGRDVQLRALWEGAGHSFKFSWMNSTENLELSDFNSLAPAEFLQGEKTNQLLKSVGNSGLLSADWVYRSAPWILNVKTAKQWAFQDADNDDVPGANNLQDSLV